MVTNCRSQDCSHMQPVQMDVPHRQGHRMFTVRTVVCKHYRPEEKLRRAQRACAALPRETSQQPDSRSLPVPRLPKKRYACPCASHRSQVESLPAQMETLMSHPHRWVPPHVMRRERARNPGWDKVPAFCHAREPCVETAILMTKSTYSWVMACALGDDRHRSC